MRVWGPAVPRDSSGAPVPGSILLAWLSPESTAAMSVHGWTTNTTDEVDSKSKHLRESRCLKGKQLRFHYVIPTGGGAGKQKVCSQKTRQKYRGENKKNFKKLNYFIKIKAIFRTKCYFWYSWESPDEIFNFSSGIMRQPSCLLGNWEKIKR